MIELLLSPVGIAFVCFAYYDARMRGQLTFALPREAVADNIHAYVLSNRISVSENADDANSHRGRINQHDLTVYIREQMDQHNFPRMKLYDLRKSIIDRLQASDDIELRIAGHDVHSAFKAVATEYDTRRKRWT